MWRESREYDVRPADVELLVAEGIVRFKMFKAANPDGDDNQRNVFKKSVSGRISGGLRLGLIISAFRRILSQPDLWAAVVAPPPKPVKTSSIGASTSVGASASAGASVSSGAPSSTVASTSVASTSAAPAAPAAAAGGKAAAKSGKRAVPVDQYSDVSDAADDFDVDDADAAGDDDDNPSKRSLSSTDLNAMFRGVQNVVC